jgi:hypothetical protein
MNKKFVTIMRKWNNPTIDIAVTDGIELKIPMDDFQAAMLSELQQSLKYELQKQINSAEFKSVIRDIVGSVTWVFTQESFDAKLATAMKAVQELIEKRIDGLCHETIDKMLKDIINDIIKSVKQESTKIATAL